MKFLDLDEMHCVRKARPTAANILRTISFETKEMEKNHSCENFR